MAERFSRRHGRIARNVGCLLIALIAWSLVVTNFALAESPRIEDVRLGLDGKYKVGFWTPVKITLTGGDKPLRGRFELTVPDGDGLPCRYVDAEDDLFEIPASGKVTLWRYVKIGRVGGKLTMHLRDAEGKELARLALMADRLPPALPATRELIVTVGRSVGVENSISQLDEQAGVKGVEEKEELGSVVGLVEKTADLPDRWWGYEGVDTLILTTRATNVLDQMTNSQYDALLQWVRMGGRLVACVGYRGKEIFGRPDNRFAELAPGKFEHVYGRDNVDRLDETKGLEALAVASQPLAALELTLFRDVPRQYVEAYEGKGPDDIPTIVRRPFGFGQLVLVTFDLDEPPCSNWQGRSRLVVKIIRGATQTKKNAEEQRASRVTHYGYKDLSGQMRSALDQFHGITLVAFSWITGLMVFYILLIGPIDYLLLRRFFRHMHWTWVTFPATVVLFCLLAFLLAGQWQGQQLKINQVDLVDLDFTQQPDDKDKSPPVFVRGTTWANLYSPHNEAYDLSLQIDPPGDSQKKGVLLTWNGLPGKSLGGMQSRANFGSGNAEGYAIDANPIRADEKSALAGMPIQVSATKALVSRWWCNSRLATPSRLTTYYHGVGRLEELQGQVTNPLQVELTDCVLFYGSAAWVLLDPTIGPGQSFRVESDTRMRSQSWQLNQDRVVESHDVTAPWDTASHDVPRIVEMMMFHEAARGRAYTKLTHRYQAYADLSEHLRLGRAILVGRTKTPAGKLLRDGRELTDKYDNHWTFYRLVLPVQRITR